MRKFSDDKSKKKNTNYNLIKRNDSDSSENLFFAFNASL